MGPHKYRNIEKCSVCVRERASLIKLYVGVSDSDEAIQEDFSSCFLTLSCLQRLCTIRRKAQINFNQTHTHTHNSLLHLLYSLMCFSSLTYRPTHAYCFQLWVLRVGADSFRVSEASLQLVGIVVPPTCSLCHCVPIQLWLPKPKN